MFSNRGTFISLILAVFSLSSGLGLSAEESVNSQTEQKPAIAITEDMGTAMMREAAKVRAEFEMDAKAGIEIPFPQRDIHIRGRID